MRILMYALLLALAALPASCGQSYWVPGLTLPYGAAIVSREQGTSDEMGGVGLPYIAEVLPRFDRVLTVSFDCPGAWSGVVSHFDECLVGQGYAQGVTDPEAEGGGTSANEAPLPGLQFLNLAALRDTMRVYYDKDARYCVFLMHVPQPAPGYGSAAAGEGGEFTLTVAHMR